MRGRYPATSTSSRRSRASKTRRRGLVGVTEDGHHPVAEPLDDLAPMRGHRRLDRPGDLAQQLERDVVAGLQRPVREAHEVGEHDRQPIVAELAAGAVRDHLPHLQGREPGLLEDPRPLRGRLAEPPGDQRPRVRAGGGQRVAVAAVAREQLAGELQRSHQAGLEPALGGTRVIAGLGHPFGRQYTTISPTVTSLNVTVRRV